jgi:hypothetical protein
MSSTVLYMSMSLDGFIAGPNESLDNGLGDGGERLHEWAFPGAEGGDFEAAVARLRGVNRQVYDEMMRPLRERPCGCAAGCKNGRGR